MMSLNCLLIFSNTDGFAAVPALGEPGYDHELAAAEVLMQ